MMFKEVKLPEMAKREPVVKMGFKTEPKVVRRLLITVISETHTPEEMATVGAILAGFMNDVALPNSLIEVEVSEGILRDE
jgi:hypothetical protein